MEKFKVMTETDLIKINGGDSGYTLGYALGRAIRTGRFIWFPVKK